MKKAVLITLGVIFIIVILSFLFLVGFSKVSTNKDVYETGKEVVVSFSDFRLLRCTTGPNINFYYKTSEGWDKITHTNPITFGRPYCVDGKLALGAYPADVVSCCILCKPFLSGEYIWPSQIYEKKDEKEICGDIPEPVVSYQLRPASPGKYKIEFGNARKIFEIKEVIPPELKIPEDETAKLTTEEIKNAEYYSTVYKKKIRLKDGIYYEEPDPMITSFGTEVSVDKIATGDLNNDGKEDAAVILRSYYTGGSISNYDLSILINKNGNPDYLTYKYLGYGVIINSVNIQSGEIILDIVIRGPDDMPCCPTLQKIVKYKLTDSQIIEITEDETAKCSPIDFPDYEIAKEFKVDLNNDQKEEILRVYWKIANKYEERVGPIMVKIFSGTEDCPKESFSYQGRGNLVWGAQVFSNFWGDGANAVMVRDVSYAGGSGSSVVLRFFTYRNGEYAMIEGPQFGGHNWLCCKFDEDNGSGKKIIGAESWWGPNYEDYCAGCTRRLQFMIYTWNGEGYTKTVAGITQNKYLSESIDEILEKEPSVLNPQ